MGFVVAGFIGLALLLGAIWLVWFLFLHTKERIRREHERRDLERERLLRTPGEPLRCHGCGDLFEGPIPDIGCVNCHTSALVIPECQQQTASDGRSRKVGSQR